MINQCLLIDGDDTLWENNVYFERAIEEFIDLVIHEHLTRTGIRRILDQIELANCRLHGYGARSFVRSMHDCYRQVHSEEIPTDKAQVITDLGKRILGAVPELISGVQETLLYLRPRHRLILLTKGNFEEQSTKVERSGLRPLFEDVIIVSEKTVDTYMSVAEQAQVDVGRTWMIGNSPKSDIVPALAAGFRAVLVPHAQTWQLEQQEVPQAPEHLLLVDRFTDLMTHF